MSKEEKTLIAAEMAGIILGRIFKAAIIIVGIIGIFLAGMATGSNGKNNSNEPQKVVDAKAKAN